jgi:hypothetical protein
MSQPCKGDGATRRRKGEECDRRSGGTAGGLRRAEQHIYRRYLRHAGIPLVRTLIDTASSGATDAATAFKRLWRRMTREMHGSFRDSNVSSLMDHRR